ncbi:hypothetical protein HQ32_04671 [Prauserella sp. Am3]|nr:hypothetical protein HQ32_04671 [Prauserella sp. Am3]
MPVLAGAEPLPRSGTSGTGVLLCDGFTGTPASMRPRGEQADRNGCATWEPQAGIGGIGGIESIGTDPSTDSHPVLQSSVHVATLEGDAPVIFERSVEFVRAVRQVGTK